MRTTNIITYTLYHYIFWIENQLKKKLETGLIGWVGTNNILFIFNNHNHFTNINSSLNIDKKINALE